MKIAVCIKAVPDTETKITIAADKKHIDPAGIKYITSPYDEFALEEAIKIKEKYGGEVVGFSLGGAEAVDVLKNSLARGLDSAIHLKDDSFTNLDPLSSAICLAAALGDQQFEVILCGQQGVGGDNNQVPSILAELLNLPQVNLVVKLEIEGNKFKAEREIEGAREVVEGTLPAVFSAQKDLNTPRYPSIKDIMAAKRKEITIKNAQDLGVVDQITKTKNQLVLHELYLPPARPVGRKIEGTADQQVKELVEALHNEAKVI
jgi:electron transfer flavoprotein beta subunit